MSVGQRQPENGVFFTRFENFFLASSEGRDAQPACSMLEHKRSIAALQKGNGGTKNTSRGNSREKCHSASVGVRANAALCQHHVQRG